MSDELTNKELAETVCDDFMWLEAVAKEPHWPYVDYAINELVRRADEAAVLRRALEDGLMDLANFPCENIGLVHDIKTHRVCPLGRDVAECWTFNGKTVLGTDVLPPHPTCAMQVRLDMARKELGL